MLNLIQKKPFVGIRRFSIKNNDKLNVFIKERGALNEYDVELSILDPSPTRSKQKSTSKWINFSILFLLFKFSCV